MPKSGWWLLCVGALQLSLSACTREATPPAALPPLPPDPRDTARTLAEKGYALYERGDYTRAADTFLRAYQYVKAPSILLMLARTHEKLGKLRDAYEIYREVAREDIALHAPAPYHEAQEHARAELAALEQRMPAVAIHVTGAPESEVWVMIDGQIAAAPGERVLLDPGKHQISADAPGWAAVRREVILEGNATRKVWLSLVTAPADRKPVASAPAQPEPQARSAPLAPP